MATAAVIPSLGFAVQDAARVEYAAAPTLRFALHIERVGGGPIRSILLDTQIQIAARRRSYEDADRDKLFDLFGRREDWGTTLRTLLWTRTTVVIPPFTGATVADLRGPCTDGLEVAASRYLDVVRARHAQVGDGRAGERWDDDGGAGPQQRPQ